MLFDALANAQVSRLKLDYLEMQACDVPTGHRHVMERGESAYIRLVYVVEGRAEFEVAGRRLSAEARSMLYLPYGTAYVSHWYGARNQFTVIDIHLLDELGNTLSFGEDARVLFRDDCGAYAGFVSDIQFSAGSSMPFMWLERISLALKLCCDIARDRVREGGDERYRRIYSGIVYLENNYAQNFPIDELARMCMLSPSSFRKLFFECKGMSPVDYRNSLRVRRAAELIKSGAYGVGEAADAVGIGDIKYFSKLFKRYTGASPGSLRPGAQ